MNNLVKRPEVKFGLIIGLGVSAYVFTEYLLGFHTKYLNIGRYSGFISTLIPIFGLYYAVKTRRLEEPDQTISFKKAFLTGLVASAIASAIISAFFFLYNTKINSGWMDKAIKEETAFLQKQGKKENEVKDQIKLMKQAYDPKNQLTSVFIGTLMNGVILSVIIAAIASRKRKLSELEVVKE